MARKRSTRGRGTGQVFESRSEGCWYARVSLGVVKGRRIMRKARAANRDEAEAALVRLQRQYGLAGSAVDATTTLDTYLTEWVASHSPTVRPSTARSYRLHVEQHIRPLLGGIRVTKLRPADVRRLIADRLAAGLSPTTVGHIVSTLHMALQRLVDEDRILTDNPAKVRRPRVDRPPVAVLTAEGAERVLTAVEDHWLEPLVRLLLGSGMRLGEALALDWRDVHLDAGYVVVRRSKTQPRAVPISSGAIAALTALRAARTLVDPAAPVFTAPIGPRTRTDDRLTKDTVTHAFPDLLERKGVPKMRVHDLRHGTASLMLAAGVPMRVIAEQLGHRNPALTAKVYAHVVPEAQAAAIRTIESRIESRSG